MLYYIILYIILEVECVGSFEKASNHVKREIETFRRTKQYEERVK